MLKDELFATITRECANLEALGKELPKIKYVSETIYNKVALECRDNKYYNVPYPNITTKLVCYYNSHAIELRKYPEVLE